MIRRLLMVAVAAALTSASLRGAEVKSVVSSQETYVGVPVTLQIRVNNSRDHDPPQIPQVDGLTIESTGPPSSRSQTSISIGPGGQRQTKIESTVYSYRVTPEREGAFTIPPVTVVADGAATITKAVRIVASTSETNDLLFVEVAGNVKEIFVGEALELTLRCWIRPYKNQQYDIVLDEANMWQLISKDSKWGYFRDRLQELAENNQRPAGRPVLRQDSEGVEREYLLYEIDATVYPDRPGKIEADDLRLIVNYPLELGRSRSPFSAFEDEFFRRSGMMDDSFFRGFGSRLAITKSRPIVAEAAIEPIIVKPIPQRGRPNDYRGAVGQYSIITEAKPTSVKVGDPITLHIAIDGTGPMDRVLAPPLAEQSDLVGDFKVPDEPLAGLVDRDRKIFTTTIRPQREGITEIPPIKMSYFDPQRAEFVTVGSRPIPIEVEAAEVLALDAIVSRQPAAADVNAESQVTATDPVAGLTLFTDASLLQSVDRPARFTNTLLVGSVVPPLMAMLLLVFSSRHRFGSLVSARRRFEQSLAASQSAVEVGEALERYLAARFRLAESRLTRDQTVGRLRADGNHALAIRTERLYATCEKAGYRAANDDSVETLRGEARAIVAELNQSKLKSTPAIRIGNLSSTSSLLLVALMLSPSLQTFATDSQLALSPDQQRQLLTEGLSIYANAAQESDEIEAQQEFARAADKFQLLVDSGVQNDRLFFNLAAAQLRAGQTGNAIANLRRALRLRPDSRLYGQTLMLAERQRPAQRAGTMLSITTVNEQIARFISPRVTRGLLVSAWFAFWGILMLRVLRFRFHWRAAALLTGCCVLLTSGLCFLRTADYVRDGTAVLVATDISLRSGDGEEFPEQTVLSAEGSVVQVLDRRGDWTRIELDDGAVGWIDSDSCEEI